MKPKTKYTCNPCPSVEMNNGLGSRQPFVTEKVGYRVGLDPVELGDDPDVRGVVNGCVPFPPPSPPPPLPPPSPPPPPQQPPPPPRSSR